MQFFDPEQYTNTNNWRVEHDENTQLYYLKNDNGNKSVENWTTRVFAERALAVYLEKMNKPKRPGPGRPPKEEKVDVNP